MKEFRSKLENIIPAVELKFPDTAGFKPFSRYFHSDSIAHPAKANCYLLYYLIKKFTMEGDTILDPMAGTSSTGIIGSLLGRNTVCVDIEEKFVELSRKNIGFLERSGRKKGELKIIQGDARKLSELLKNADVVVTSPPYSETVSKDAGGPNTLRKGFKRGISTDASRQYSPSEENIGNLPHGSVDAVITSPPYAHDSVVHKNERRTKVAKEKFGYSQFYSTSEVNIGNLKKETYLEAMLKVYSEMFKVLKSNGLAIIIIKPFIRNKKVVDLPWHTWLLLEKVGFKLSKLYKLRLKQDSFWRILYKKKYPNVPEIKHEYVLVAQKTLERYNDGS